MKTFYKILLVVVLALTTMTAKAQIPYFAGTAGDGNFYAYTSVKFRPTINAQETYTTFQYGITDYLALGSDLYTGVGCSYLGYSVRGKFYQSAYFNIGGQATASFDLNNSHKYSYLTAGLYMNGAITSSLFWVSNTWYGVNHGSANTLDQWWYLGYWVPINKDNSITPMVGVIHDWFFKSEPSIAIGAYYTYKNFNFYAWCDKINQKYPRIVFGVDLKLCHR